MWYRITPSNRHECAGLCRLTNFKGPRRLPKSTQAVQSLWRAFSHQPGRQSSSRIMVFVYANASGISCVKPKILCNRTSSCAVFAMAPCAVSSRKFRARVHADWQAVRGSGLADDGSQHFCVHPSLQRSWMSVPRQQTQWTVCWERVAVNNGAPESGMGNVAKVHHHWPVPKSCKAQQGLRWSLLAGREMSWVSRTDSGTAVTRYQASSGICQSGGPRRGCSLLFVAATQFRSQCLVMQMVDIQNIHPGAWKFLLTNCRQNCCWEYRCLCEAGAQPVSTPFGGSRSLLCPSTHSTGTVSGRVKKQQKH